AVQETAVSSPTSLAATATAVPVAAANSDNSALSLAEVDPDAITTEETAPPPDPIGFALGWLVLLGLLAVLMVCVWQLGGHWAVLTQADIVLNQDKGRNLLMWVLIIIGLIVSGYLTYVEMTQVTAVCGPVGECNLVQSSPYAQIMGIPIAVLGLLFYLTVTGLWLLQHIEKVRRLAVLTLIALALFGTLFSLYLTLLELLVIGAICMWCLTSAVTTGLICLLVTMGVVKRLLPPDPQWQAS
ncbi:MAG: vitamin K epoxide reductase family protein, partial [Candidatus Kapabacteria bacterium]|nr:vitamin K epoxide reductase family protein [Candidatus Kapabacteria bacterium]